MECSGQTVLITGGGSGIGLALAKEFSVLGNTVIVCGRNKETLEQATKEYSHIKTFVCDISDSLNRQNLFEFLNTNYPDLNFLINNAAVYREYSFLEGNDKENLIEEEIKINLMAQIQLTDKLLPLLRNQSQSAIVNVTSAISRIIHPTASVYCASKAGLSMFTQALRLQLKKTPIKVFEVSPPCVNTDMCQEARGRIEPKQAAQEVLQGIKKNRFNIYVGKTQLFYLIERLSPWLARNLIGRI